MTCEVVKLENLVRDKRLYHIKNLIASVKDAVVMEPIICNNCLTRVNPISEGVLVNTRNMAVGTKHYTLLEPACPVCGAFIQGEQFVHIAN